MFEDAKDDGLLSATLMRNLGKTIIAGNTWMLFPATS